MKPIPALACVTALVLSAVPSVAQDVVPLTQEEAMELVNGKKLDTKNAQFGPVRLDLREGGRLYGTNQGNSDSGEWRVEEGKLCLKWRRWNYTGCGVLQRRGNLIEHLNVDGTLHFTVAPG